MKNKNRGMAISQIMILVISILAVAYFLGSEVPVVSAQGEYCFYVSTNIYPNIWEVSGNNMKCKTCSPQTQMTISEFCKQNPSYCDSPLSGAKIKTNVQKTNCPAAATPAGQTPGLPSIPVPAPKKTPAPTQTQTGQTPEGECGEEDCQPDTVPKPGVPTPKIGFLKTEIIGKLQFGQLISNAGFALAIYGGLRFVFKFTKFNPDLEKRIAEGAALGYFVGSTLKDIGFKGSLKFLSTGLGSSLIGIGVAVLYVALKYKDTKLKQVSFTCYPWDAPTGGKDCQKCNSGDIPCTEYRCKSLGQACELVNRGTTEELCFWNNSRDVTPPVIQPWEKTLTIGYKYNPDNAISPPDRGVKIVPQANNAGCVKPFTNIQFGVNLDEPAKCKIDSIRKNNFSAMSFFFGGSSITKYNHSQIMSLPSPESLEAENISLTNNGRFTMYVRCQDANGNANIGNFVFNFCVDQGPDTTAPLIVTTSILNNMPIPFNQTSADLLVYVNEPSECKWSSLDQSYDNMENQMTCRTNVLEFNAQMLYQCGTTLTGLRDRVNNDFYFRCRDQPSLNNTANESKRNTNTQSYKFTLIGTRPLVISSVEPNGTTISDSTDVIKVDLKAETFAGYKEGQAICSFSDTGDKDSFVEFFNTDSHKHSQELFLSEGDYTYHVQCVDLGGNSDSKEVSFRVEADDTAPVVVRVFHQSTSLKVITNENATCVFDNFDCSYLFEDGIKMSSSDNDREHSTAWDSKKNFYIKCADSFGNRPNPNECSIIAKPFEIK